ncbi:mitoguardin isoform X1 [Lingula anatina]|uniref:Mitoguardin isoform X1 n=1 Tax=Lingula anatina TaxID=7574 RepID=A0A1S3JPH0_LINAN|nr:mitoguardin isoform X1 [Lingula anatina]|eukprot:XP_013412253.1 mitoguardin isoform X1 [Lingula anatina]
MPNFSNLKLSGISLPVRVTVISVTLGVALMGILAAYFRRRKRSSPPRRPSGVLEKKAVPAPVLSPNGDLPNKSASAIVTRSQSPRSLVRDKSNSMSSLGGASTSTHSTICNTPVPVDTSSMSAQDLCQIGMESLSSAIRVWEDALEKLDVDQQVDDVDGNQEHIELSATDLRQQISDLLDKAYGIQDEYERTVVRQVDSAALDTAMAALADMNREYELKQKASRGDEGSSDDEDEGSYFSAAETPDLSDLDTLRTLHHKQRALYEAGLLELKFGSIPCRTLRTKTLNCSSDAEFLAKLHCVRLALGELLKDHSIREWIEETGKEFISSILIKADRDPEDFYTSYDEMMAYIKNPDNMAQVEEELMKGRGVRAITFYDVALDFILMDAFDDLQNPPSSLTSVMENRWLSNGFKETALATAVWSVLKAKRSMLKFSDGFMAHFYAISETVSPVLAWGFMGPVEEMRNLCFFFKGQVLGFIQDMFDFQKVRFNTVEELADDILRLIRERRAILAEKLLT